MSPEALLQEPKTADYQELCQELFPSEVILVLSQQSKNESVLLKDELSLVTGYSEKRLQEFSTGRWCARNALKQLGHKPVSILKNDKGAPIWPQGFAGSISHCKGMYGAAVANTRRYRSLGFDVEHLQTRSQEKAIVKYICTEKELERLCLLSGKNLIKESRAIFSIKESFYKCLAPLVQKYFGFKYAQVQINWSREEFTLEIVKDITTEFISGMRFNGKAKLINQHVFTGMCLPQT
ncbi:MAG: 4'-phosphopantetheinyl transferase superfamily protein [Fibrobacteria bacterium]|nr:4'-phosphopantetheinyl transferase superfamily protein [Fibrobacteria bacterium]